MVLMLYGCGMRVNELATLSFDRYNKSEKSFTIKAKGDKDHKIYIYNKETLEAYKKVCDMVPDDCIWVFTADGTTHLSITGIAHIVRELAKDAGVEKNVTPHAFRRGCATALIENDVDLSIVKDVLGHSNITTTMRYVSLSEKKVKDTMKNYSPLNLI
jgi:integrase/recombinase XerD